MVIVKTAVPGVSEQALARFAQRARKAAGLRGQVNVLLTSSREIRALNRRYRHQDKPTDVLSFPPADWSTPTSGRRRHSAGHGSLATDPLSQFSGDIVISSAIAARNSRFYRHPAAQELKILILHGMLHLAGYDHESDRGQMARREDRLRRQLGLGDGLIRRTLGRQSPVASRQPVCGSDLGPEKGLVAHALGRQSPVAGRQPVCGSGLRPEKALVAQAPSRVRPTDRQPSTVNRGRRAR